jgi:hypothetical protein
MTCSHIERCSKCNEYLEGWMVATKTLREENTRLKAEIASLKTEREETQQ